MLRGCGTMVAHDLLIFVEIKVHICLGGVAELLFVLLIVFDAYADYCLTLAIDSCLVDPFMTLK